MAKFMIFMSIILLFLTSGCHIFLPAGGKSSSSQLGPKVQAATWQPNRDGTITASSEIGIPAIPLSGPINSPDAEISGMAWYRVWLILLPQYPALNGGKSDGAIFALAREDIKAFLNDQLHGPL